MNLSRLFKFFSKKNTMSLQAIPPLIPFYWEDDFLQVEITDRRNKAYMLKKLEEVRNFSAQHYTPQGFTDVYMREDKQPIATISLELNYETLDTLLKKYLHKATHIQYEASKLIDCNVDGSYAYQADGFTVFVDTDDDYVKYIWVRSGLIVSNENFENLLQVLYIIGESYKMDLVDWNSLEYIELNNRIQVKEYLMGWWK
jgi:hypothetical protein